MGQGLILKKHLIDIANAIRVKLNSQDTYTPDEMATAIGLIDGTISGPIIKSTNTDVGLVTDTYLSNIGDAIRAKLDVETRYTPAQMADAILSITSHISEYGIRSDDDITWKAVMDGGTFTINKRYIINDAPYGYYAVVVNSAGNNARIVFISDRTYGTGHAGRYGNGSESSTEPTRGSIQNVVYGEMYTYNGHNFYFRYVNGFPFRNGFVPYIQGDYYYNGINGSADIDISIAYEIYSMVYGLS